MTDLNSLVIFAKVIEAKSFSEAARRLRMPVSTVSRRVAELEDELGIRLIQRSTRSLRLTDVGAEFLERARHCADLSAEVETIASNHLSNVAGTLRLSAPPSISESLLAPLVLSFQESYPEVRVQVLVTERMLDHIPDGVDIVFRLGAMKDSTLMTRRILTYRHQLVASPAYLEKHKPPAMPQDLHGHRLLAFSRWRPQNRWSFVHVNGQDEERLTFQPHLSINEYDGLAAAALAGSGIGELPPIVQPQLLKEGRLIEVMPLWRFRTYDLLVVHLGDRRLSRPVRLFKDFAAKTAPELFPTLPS